MIYSEMVARINKTAQEVEKLIKSLPEEDQSEEVLEALKNLQNSSGEVITKEQEAVEEITRVLAEDVDTTEV